MYVLKKFLIRFEVYDTSFKFSKLKIKPVLPPAAVRPDTKRLKLEASWRLFLAVRCVIETS